MSSPTQTMLPSDTSDPTAPFQHAIVATDALSASDSVVQFAARLSKRDRTRLTMLSAVEPVPYPVPVNDLAITTAFVAPADDELLRARRHAVAAQCVRAGILSTSDVIVEPSVTLSAILSRAEERGADLIVIGLGHHAAVDRLFGAETAVQVAKDARIPSLAIPAAIAGDAAPLLPRNAVVGVDFSENGIAAARAAARLVGAYGRITLAHVDPLVEPLPAMLADWPPHVLDRLNDAFGRVLDALALPTTMQVETISLAGNVGNELLSLAMRIHADVIAVGRTTSNMIERLVLGSVATKVIRGASCAVLVVPLPE
jgi:nucleotide-binding universal stress UspA family protein